MQQSGWWRYSSWVCVCPPLKGHPLPQHITRACSLPDHYATTLLFHFLFPAVKCQMNKRPEERSHSSCSFKTSCSLTMRTQEHGGRGTGCHLSHFKSLSCSITNQFKSTWVKDLGWILFCDVMSQCCTDQNVWVCAICWLCLQRESSIHLLRRGEGVVTHLITN